MKKLIFLLLLIPTLAYGDLVEGTNFGFVTTIPTANPNGNVTQADTFTRAIKITAPATDGTITSMGWWIDSKGGMSSWNLSIYSDNATGNGPVNLLASANSTVDCYYSGWTSSNLAITYAFSANTIYWLTLRLVDTATDTYIDSLDSASYKRDRKNAGSGLPDPWGTSDSQSNGTLAIYANYTPTVAAQAEQQKVISFP